MVQKRTSVHGEFGGIQNFVGGFQAKNTPHFARMSTDGLGLYRTKDMKKASIYAGFIFYSDLSIMTYYDQMVEGRGFEPLTFRVRS